MPPNTFYDFWSGIGGDFVYLSAVAVAWHHLNCHQTRCWRIARHRYDGYCRKHVKEKPR